MSPLRMREGIRGLVEVLIPLRILLWIGVGVDLSENGAWEYRSMGVNPDGQNGHSGFL